MYKTRLESLEAVYIYIYISRLLEKNNNEINRINLDNEIAIEPKKLKI